MKNYFLIKNGVCVNKVVSEYKKDIGGGWQYIVEDKGQGGDIGLAYDGDKFEVVPRGPVVKSEREQVREALYEELKDYSDGSVGSVVLRKLIKYILGNY